MAESHDKLNTLGLTVWTVWSVILGLFLKKMEERNQVFLEILVALNKTFRRMTRGIVWYGETYKSTHVLKENLNLVHMIFKVSVK